MKKVVMNPYLPLWEYIPDGEPRIFDDRLYVYGSHDFAGGEKGYCPGDYMAWSTPLDDLSAWECQGVAYPRSESPDITTEDAMAAPDVVKGVDSRYYLYYNTNQQKNCRVAVSERPEGPFRYYGDVQNADGTPYTQYKMFDPGVLVDDDKKVYLYVGFCMPGVVPEQYRGLPSPFAETSLGFELAQDMKTILSEPVAIIPGGNLTEGTGFEGHGFYEASSPRKINGKYVMVYSAETSHEMAYAISDMPLGPYTYAGPLVSSADLGFRDNNEPMMPYGNVHGGLVELGGDWYIFYHRQTHGVECSRQGCAEKLPIREDGWFDMAEITSCGLNHGPLPDDREYNACYCCRLSGPAISKEKTSIRECRRATEPHIYEETNQEDEKKSLQYIAGIQPDTVVGFKYFDFHNPKAIELKLRGHGEVKVKASLEDDLIGCTSATLTGEWQIVTVAVENTLATADSGIRGVHPLYFIFNGENVQFAAFSFVH